MVFANGILALSFATALLIILFGGASHSLVPLFAVGAFLAFTLSQTGMVVHWARLGGPGWQWKSLINAAGGIATGITLLVIGFSKFAQGAWLTILVIPLLVTMFLQVQGHYRKVGAQLTLKGLPPSLKPDPPPRVVIPISGIHRGIVEAVNFARSISQDVTAVYVELEPDAGRKLRLQWDQWFADVRLVVVPSPYRSIIGPLLDYLDSTDEEHNDGQLCTVLLPEFVPAHWWESLLHNQTALLLKAALLYRRRSRGFQQAIIDIPYHLKR